MSRMAVGRLGFRVAAGLGIVGGLTWTGPAAAHPGSHHGMSFGEVIGHFVTGSHAWPLIAAAAVGLAVYVVGQRRARMAAQRRTGGERRP